MENLNGVEKGETEFDLRSSRLKLIGKLVEEKTIIYLQTIREKSDDNLRNYFYVVKTIYRNVKGYARDNEDHKDRIENIDDYIEKIEKNLGENSETILTDYERKNIFQDLEEMEDQVQALRMDVGLDIPRKSEYNPETAGIDVL